jgi:CheY-like chemotaxis protein
MKVVITDDEEDIRSVASMSLGILGGIDVVEAESGKDGIAKAAAEQPDVILLDAMMPEMDGPATLEALRNNPDTASIPVIFLTAKAIRSEVDKLRSMGALGVLSKPFDPTTLATQVREMLEKS